MIAWLDRLRSTESGRRNFERFSLWFLVALAAFLRLIDLAHPQRLVFDETYYVKDAWTLFNTGAERTWPANFDSQFETGSINGYLADPSYVVHPPLGKWIIGLGMWLFGGESAFSWRISTALLGIASVVLVFILAKRILRSHAWGLVAGFLMAIDGQAIVMSRVALLDGILTFFVLLAFWFVLQDRERVLAALDSGQALLWRRPWLYAAGITLGAATAVKWSGAYFLAAFGLYVVGYETIARLKQAGDNTWILKAVIQAARDFMLLVPIAVATYFASWSGWLISGTGYGADKSSNPLLALWLYHVDAYEFHVGLRTPHSYQANPLTWLFIQRPTSMFYEGFGEGESGCGLPSGCSSAITALPNPLIWLAAAAAILWIAYRWILERNADQSMILLGLVAGYLPWLIYLNRTVFQFYTIVFEGWMMIALAYALRHWVVSRGEDRIKKARVSVGYFLAFASAISLFFLPIWFGTEIPYWFWSVHMWLPGWI